MTKINYIGIISALLALCVYGYFYMNVERSEDMAFFLLGILFSMFIFIALYSNKKLRDKEKDG